MNIEKSILDIFIMTIAVDGRIDESELNAVNNVLDEMKYDFTSDLRDYFSEISSLSLEEMKTNFDIAIEDLNSMEIQEKKYILKYTLKLVDADSIMHDNEVKLIGHIMEKWGIKQ